MFFVLASLLMTKTCALDTQSVADSKFEFRSKLANVGKGMLNVRVVRGQELNKVKWLGLTPTLTSYVIRPRFKSTVCLCIVT